MLPQESLGCCSNDMGLSGVQSNFLAYCYDYLKKQHGMVVAHLRVSTAAVQTLDNITTGWSMNLNLGKKYADKYACDCRELIQNFRDQTA